MSDLILNLIGGTIGIGIGWYVSRWISRRIDAFTYWLMKKLGSEVRP